MDDNPPIPPEHVSQIVGTVGEELTAALTGVGFHPLTSVFLESSDATDYGEAIGGIAVENGNELNSTLRGKKAIIVAGSRPYEGWGAGPYLNAL